MARIVRSKSRREPRKVGQTNVHYGNAPEMGGFKHFTVGHEIARPTTTVDGQQVYSTPTGKQFTIRKMSS